MQMNPYLFFDGKCEAAFKFYEKVLGGKIEAMLTHDDVPMESKVPPEQRKRIVHARMKIGDVLLMGSDAPAADTGAKGFSININVGKPAEAERVFGDLAKNGTIKMPIQETFWAERFGMLLDQFGTPWMVNCEKKRT